MPSALQSGRVPLLFLLIASPETRAEAGRREGKEECREVYIPVPSELRLHQAVEGLGEEGKERILETVLLTSSCFFFNVWVWNEVDMAT